MQTTFTSRPEPPFLLTMLAPPPFNQPHVTDFVPQTSGRGTGTPSQRDQDVHKENLRLESENLELRLQLEQNVKDVPRLRVRGTVGHLQLFAPRGSPYVSLFSPLLHRIRCRT